MHSKKDPFILFGFAAQCYFRNDRDKFMAFFTSYFALADLLEHDKMKPFRKAGDEVELHLAVIEVAASEKLSDGWKFEPESFFPGYAKLQREWMGVPDNLTRSPYGRRHLYRKKLNPGC